MARVAVHGEQLRHGQPRRGEQVVILLLIIIIITIITIITIIIIIIIMSTMDEVRRKRCVERLRRIWVRDCQFEEQQRLYEQKRRETYSQR